VKAFRNSALGLGFASVLLLAALARFAPPAGAHHAALSVFLGHFHPLMVHVPIGLILLVPILEIAGGAENRAHLRGAAGFVLGLAAAATVATALDGWLLAWSGGYKGDAVVRHMWSGIGLAGLCVAAAWAKPAPAGRSGAARYWLLLLCTLGMLFRAGHEGGALTQGSNYFTRYMPGRLRSWLHVTWPPPSAPAAPAVLPAAGAGSGTAYAALVEPILKRSCVSCHNPDKMKGGLDLATYAKLMEGGENGPVVVPWLPEESDLLRRISLPKDDGDFMPDDGKNLLSTEEIDLIGRWIAAGASDKQPLEALKRARTL
jgi:uncharacterized membrane protein